MASQRSEGEAEVFRKSLDHAAHMVYPAFIVTGSSCHRKVRTPGAGRKRTGVLAAQGGLPHLAFTGGHCSATYKVLQIVLRQKSTGIGSSSLPAAN